MLTMPKLSLYIHFPWCFRKCPYCDFNSYALQQNQIPEDEYLKNIILDLKSKMSHIQGRKIETIFLGGGTPSIFSSNSFYKLFNFLNKLDILKKKNIEITLEVNPETVEYKKFCEYKNIGINRISLGIQSFQNKQLKILGRLHNESTINSTIENIIRAGFNNLNFDLMYGLPNQNIDDALDDLNQAFIFKPKHLSWYQLTLEPNTKFFINPPKLPNQDIIYQIELEGKKNINNNNFKKYEISSYAKDIPFQSKHNLNYWKFGDYIGIGAGAHSKITDTHNKIIKRFYNRKNPILYMKEKKIPVKEFNIHPKDLPYEFFLNVLRLESGFTPKFFEKRTGLNFNTIKNNLNIAINNKLLIQNNKHYCLTKMGKNFLNDFLYIFLP